MRLRGRVVDYWGTLEEDIIFMWGVILECELLWVRDYLLEFYKPFGDCSFSGDIVIIYYLWLFHDFGFEGI